jgi:hypothetical protein
MRALSPAKPDLWSMLLGSPEAPAAVKHHTITISAGHRAKHGSAGPFGARLGGAAGRCAELPQRRSVAVSR